MDEMTIYDNIPDYIKKHGKFCCWKYEEREGKRTKIPYHPFTRERARSNDPGSFVDYQMACCFAEGSEYDGIGLGIFGEICAIDIDHCVTESGELTGDAKDIITIMQSYTELSPSGKGIHILFQAKEFSYDKELYYIMNSKDGIEVYVAGATNKYVTVTGNCMREYPFSFGERSENLQMILARYMERPVFKNVAVNAVNAVNGANAVKEPNTSADDGLPERAFNSKNGDKLRRLWDGEWSEHDSQSEADLALCMHLAFWTGKDAARMDELFRQSALMRDKWDRQQNGSTYGAITIQKAISGCTETYTGSSKENCAKKQAEDDFPPLIDLDYDIANLPPFPVEALPSVIANQVRAVAKHTQTSEDMAAVMSLGVLAVCLQGKYRVEGSPGYYEPLSLYTVIIAAPGERKSSVMGEMTGCLYDYEQEYNEVRKGEIRANKQERKRLETEISSLQERLRETEDEAMKVKLRSLEDELAELPELKKVRFIADDCSSEALTSLLANNDGRIAVISTEGGIFELMSGRYSPKANIDVWLKGHCGDTIMVDRKGRESETIYSPHLSAILTIQPCILEDIMSDKKMSGRGLVARFLFSSPPSLIGKRTFGGVGIPEETARKYKELVYRLMALPVPDKPSNLQLSEEASDLMGEYFAEHEKYLAGEGQAIAEWASKYIGAVLRIAGLIHVAMENGSNTIEALTIRNAISMGKYFLEHSNYAYSLMGNDSTLKLAKFVMGKIKKGQIKEIKQWELGKLCRCKLIKNVQDMEPVLEMLEEYGQLKRVMPEARPGSGRKPDIVIVVNPKVFEDAVKGE